MNFTTWLVIAIAIILPVATYIAQNKKNKVYKIREILPKDNETMAEIVRYNLKNNGLDIPGTVYFDSDTDNLYEAYSGDEKKGYYVLADENDNAIGGIGFAEFAPIENCAELQKLYLADSAKGKGYGYKLIEFIEDKMREKGYSISYLETHHNLQAAMHLYKKCGYENIERPESVMHGAMDNFLCKKL